MNARWAPGPAPTWSRGRPRAGSPRLRRQPAGPPDQPRPRSSAPHPGGRSRCAGRAARTRAPPARRGGRWSASGCGAVDLRAGTRAPRRSRCRSRRAAPPAPLPPRAGASAPPARRSADRPAPARGPGARAGWRIVPADRPTPAQSRRCARPRAAAYPARAAPPPRLPAPCRRRRRRCVPRPARSPGPGHGSRALSAVPRAGLPRRLRTAPLPAAARPWLPVRARSTQRIGRPRWPGPRASTPAGRARPLQRCSRRRRRPRPTARPL